MNGCHGYLHIVVTTVAPMRSTTVCNVSVYITEANPPRSIYIYSKVLLVRPPETKTWAP